MTKAYTHMLCFTCIVIINHFSAYVLFLLCTLYLSFFHIFCFLLITKYSFLLNRLMADQGTSPPPSPSHEAGHSRRKATRLRDLAKRRSGGQKTPLDIDVATGVATGPNATNFQSYLGFLVREHVSILTPSWDKVTPAQKDMLWQDVLVSVSFFSLLI